MREFPFAAAILVLASPVFPQAPVITSGGVQNTASNFAVFATRPPACCFSRAMLEIPSGTCTLIYVGAAYSSRALTVAEPVPNVTVAPPNVVGSGYPAAVC